MNKTRAASFIAVILVSLTLYGCDDQGKTGAEQSDISANGSPQPGIAAPEAPNLLLITIDTLRGDYLGCYGREDVETPEIDRMAGEGARFAFCVAHNTVTLPSHANILTGTDPRIHGIHDNNGFRLQAKSTTIAEILKAAGFNTGAFVGAFVLDSRFGLGQGFDIYDDYYGTKRPGNPFVTERPAEDVIRPALSWIKARDKKGRWFAWIHVYDPHWPHEAPPPFDSQFAENPYAGEISYVDHAFAPLFQHLRTSGSLDNTVVVITSDHGEAFGEHDEMTHGIFAYNSTLRVPLIIRAPWAVKAGTVIENRVRHIDLLPTMLELLRVSIPSDLEGVSLLKDLSEQDSYFEALTANLNRGWAPLRGIFRENWKFIDLPLPELYDMSADPDEDNNVISQNAQVARSLKTTLADMVSTQAAALNERIEEEQEIIDKLKDLGYITSSSVVQKDTYGPDDDPKRLIHLNNKLNQAIMEESRGNYDKAEFLINEILAQRPDMAIAYEHLTEILIKNGKADKAIGLLKDLIKRGVTRKESLKRLAITLMEVGRYQEAVSIFAELYSSGTDDLDILHFYAVCLSETGQYEQAETIFKEIFKKDPGFIEGLGNYGWMLIHLNRDQEALKIFNQALEFYPQHAASLHGKGLIFERNQQWENAISYYTKALKADPERHEARLQLAIVLTRVGQFQQAIQLLKQFLETAPEYKFAEERKGAQRLLDRLQGS